MLFACSKNTAKVQECSLLAAIVLATCSKSASDLPHLGLSKSVRSIALCKTLACGDLRI